MSEGKSKFTASVRESLVESLDKKVAQLKVNRSAAVEQAIEMWLRKIAEEEEEAYFAKHAQELNEDARWWNELTGSEFLRSSWDD